VILRDVEVKRKTMGMKYLEAALDDPPPYDVSRSIAQEEVAFP
jgi:hypothetical protein